ncbi:MAG: Ppx/GppA family phosphatase [Phycisphaerales bacterium]|nr:Ppx/GppA family phosphatase [Phycisphaerae bacterium]NNF45094.1 Ppx/GppA family phosphatase [Phycisphaerales bacterium]NNM25136.1 Ppx/GppA family phosphatase [Phycisphaerales bacterium]
MTDPRPIPDPPPDPSPARPTRSETTATSAGAGPERRVATVDVGTNSIRLLVAQLAPRGGYRLLDDEKIVARLGSGMTRSRRLDPARMQHAAQTIATLRDIAAGYDVEQIRAVATCAVREATNRDEFVNLVERVSGLRLEVISGEEEARLAFLSVRAAFDLQGQEVAVVDVGGGSTEVVLAAGGMIERIDSLPLGAVRLTEAVGGAELEPSAALHRVRRLVKRTIRARLPKPDVAPAFVIGTGGTFTTLAAIQATRRRAGTTTPSGIRGERIDRSAVRRELETLNAMSNERRAQVPGLSRDRADIIVAGLAIVEGVMRRLQVDTLRVHDRGVRDGLLLTMTRALFPGATTGQPPDRRRAAREFADACRDGARHSNHVARLACDIYDALVEQCGHAADSLRDPVARELLECAAILHDVGYIINYTRHHKHSYHLIVHSELPGFSQRELELVANIARYHRRAHPSKSHAAFQALAPEDREMVRCLAAVLRIADGLDRAHSERVERVRLEVSERTAWFTLDAEVEPQVDIWGAARKSELFAATFDLEPRFVWSGAAHAGESAAESPR